VLRTSETEHELAGVPTRVEIALFVCAHGAFLGMIAAMPRRFAALHAQRFGLVSRELPLRLGKFAIRAITTRPAMMAQA
jgi:hypothetical protein